MTRSSSFWWVFHPTSLGTRPAGRPAALSVDLAESSIHRTPFLSVCRPSTQSRQALKSDFQRLSAFLQLCHSMLGYGVVDFRSGLSSATCTSGL
ncbi:hypothetical protein [Sorangium sp. So ce176]|uniref:hypothetical protein n=1 Tax=Sorangium sp. So ce176 TaxID=3133286 RepID=UPI003F5E1157